MRTLTLLLLLVLQARAAGGLVYLASDSRDWALVKRGAQWMYTGGRSMPVGFEVNVPMASVYYIRACSGETVATEQGPLGNESWTTTRPTRLFVTGPGPDVCAPVVDIDPYETFIVSDPSVLAVTLSMSGALALWVGVTGWYMHRSVTRGMVGP
jgi:hypothetical protein